jgi:DNA processing protein
MKGSITKMDNIAVAIVGTRIPSRYGKLVTEKISSELAERGVTIISGMASGIDSIAHRSTIAAGGRTIAVFGCGVNMTYPSENINLKEKIIENGAVLSEFPMNARPERTNFPMRNRIISGLSLGTIVIEAAEKSGALITSDFALEQGKDVFAIPGNINSPKSKGTNRLIKMGAKLVENADDVIEEFPYEIKMLLQSCGKQKEITELPELSDDEMKLYSLLSEEETHIDTLIQESKMTSQKVSALLIQMELKDVIKQQSGKMFVIS